MLTEALLSPLQVDKHLSMQKDLVKTSNGNKVPVLIIDAACVILILKAA